MAQPRPWFGLHSGFALAVLISILLPRTVMAQISTPVVAEPMSLSQFEAFADVLGLSDDQMVAARRLYDQYLSDWNTLCHERQQWLRRARGTIMGLLGSPYVVEDRKRVYLPIPDDLDEIFPAAFTLRDALRRDADALFDNLTHEVALILTLEQEHRLERARAVYRRSQSRPMQIYLPETTVDVVELIEHVFDDQDEAMQQRLAEDVDRFLTLWTPLYTEAMEQVRVRIERLSHQLTPVLVERVRRYRGGEGTPQPVEMRRLGSDVTARRAGVVENLERTVRRGLDLLEFEVTEAFAAEVREALYRRAYPRTHPDLDAPERFLAAVREMDLSQRLRDGIEAEVDDWQRRHDALSAQMRDAERALRMIRLRGTDEDFMGLPAAAEHRVALGIARTELSDRLRDRIIAILPPEYAAVAQIVANEERAERSQRQRDQGTVNW